VVRNAFLSNHRDFEFDLKGSFGIGKSVHLPLPDDLEEGRFLFLANCCPNLSAFVLPERDQMINVACGYDLNNPCDKELFSVDPIVISDYFHKHFTSFHIDYVEMGKEWVKQPWSTLQMVHANFYHSIKIQALLLGDAAHATVPNIGQGMNTALADAKALNELLDEHKDDWDKVLPAFSKERVKEGNALADLSFHSFSLSSSMQFSILIRQNVRRLANKMFPSWLVEPEPMLEVTRGMKLSEAYDKMIQLGYLQKSRQINNDIMQEYFEETTGMVKERCESSRLWKSLLVIGITSGAYYYAKKK
jgi:kynurenine 3-monooxygenase